MASLSRVLILMSLLLCSSVSGQEKAKFSNLLNKEDRNYRAFYVKGKVMPWLFIGSGVTYNLGFEYIPNHNSAFEFSAVYNDYSLPTEVLDTVLQEYVAGSRIYTVNRALFGIYKRYYPLSFINPEKAKTYTALFYRYAKIHEYYQDGAPTNSIQFDQWENSVGVLQGFLFNLENEGVLDLSVGMFYKRKYAERLSESNGIQYGTESLGYNVGFRIGLNFGLGWIWRKNTITTSIPS